MRVVCISDSHCTHPKLPDGDLLIHTGDLCMRGNPQEFDSEVTAFEALRPRYPKGIIYVPGNHDKLLDLDFIDRGVAAWMRDPYHHYPPRLNPIERERILKRLADVGVTVLIEQALEIDGIKIYGSPYTPTFFDWAFMDSELNLAARWQNIPLDTQLLLTHGPPKYILDLCRNGNVGCDTLARAVQNLPALRAHIFGHIHEGAGHTTMWNKLFVNASVLDGKYQGYNPIQVLCTDTWQIVERFPDLAV